MSQIIATALERRQRVGLPYASWMLDHLTTLLAERHGIIDRALIGELELVPARRPDAVEQMRTTNEQGGHEQLEK